MSTITWPTGAEWVPRACQFGLIQPALDSRSPLSGDSKTVELPGARWGLTMELISHRAAQRAQVEALVNRLRGRVNRLAIWHPARPEPIGTLRGSPTTVSTISAGATSVSLNATTGTTLLAGDMLSLNGQLNQVATDTTAASGTMAVSLVVPMRASCAGGSSVTLIRPTGLFVLKASGVAIAYEAGGFSPPVTLELEEVFA